jgi:DNA-directed RNA polymerase specialized sigma24 family protein
MSSGTGTHDRSHESTPASLTPPGSIADPSTDFDAIYDDHAPLLRAIARSKFNIPDADIDALVHDVFASFLTSIG